MPFPGSALPAPAPDDAATGADAPDAPGPLAPVIVDGPAYRGGLHLGDAADWYAFEAAEGELLNFKLVSRWRACPLVLRPDGSSTQMPCTLPFLSDSNRTILAREGGTHYLGVRRMAVEPVEYSFRFARGELAQRPPAPPVARLPVPVPSLGLYEPGGPVPADEGSAGRAVVAVIDSGINPYHAAFRDPSPRALEHPSTYLPGYPADVPALQLTFQHASLADALRTDCKQWEALLPGTLYWIPGTRIVGAIVVPLDGQPSERITCDDPTPKRHGALVDTSGHGTMSASRAVGNGYGACPTCFVVAVQGMGSASVQWASRQPWIDLQTNSWGPFLPLWAPAPTPPLLVASHPAFLREVEDAAQRQMTFFATGNGALTRFGVAGHPSVLMPSNTPSVLRVGAHDGGHVALWPDSVPHIVSDGCYSWAAEHFSLDGATARTGGGTSAATPFAAGLVARVLSDARALVGDGGGTTARAPGVLAQGAPVGDAHLADGALTREELLQAVFHAADATPERTAEDGDVCDPLAHPLYSATPVTYEGLPRGEWLLPLVGYGAVTKATAAHASAALSGEATLPPRPLEDAYFAQEREARRPAHAALSAG